MLQAAKEHANLAHLRCPNRMRAFFAARIFFWVVETTLPGLDTDFLTCCAPAAPADVGESSRHTGRVNEEAEKEEPQFGG